MENGGIDELIGTLLKEYPSDNDNDIIVSDHTLSGAEKSVLKKGLKFVPTPTGLNRSELMPDKRKFARRMRLKEFFVDEESNPTGNETNSNDQHGLLNLAVKEQWTII